MYFINPFKGLRPTKENASSVAVSSTDHLSKDSIVDHKNNNLWSYLNVFGAENNSKSKEQFELMKKKSILIKDKNNSFYIYKISNGDHSQVGSGPSELMRIPFSFIEFTTIYYVLCCIFYIIQLHFCSIYTYNK